MRKTWSIALLSGALLAGAAGTASADSRIGVHISLGAPAPIYYPAPRVVYVPPQRVYYYPPAVYYAPAPRIVYRAKHPHWRHEHRRDRYDRRDRGWR